MMSFLSKNDDLPEDEEYSEESRKEDEADVDVYPETSMEFNKWLVDVNPKLKEKFIQLNKELVVSNLSAEEIDRCDSKLDISYQCAKMNYDNASDFFLFKTGSILSLNRSKGGFQVKQLGTIRQEKDITRNAPERRKRGLFGR